MVIRAKGEMIEYYNVKVLLTVKTYGEAEWRQVEHSNYGKIK